MNNTEHFEQFFVLATVGAGLVLVGCANVALGRRGRPFVRAALSTAACGVAVAALAALTKSAFAVQAAALLGGALLVAVLAGSGWVHRRIERALAVLRNPVVLWGAASVCGVAVVIGSGIRFESVDQATLDQETLDLEFALGRQPHQPTSKARAVTDHGTEIVLKEPQLARDPESLTSPEEKMLRSTHLSERVIRNAGPSDVSNCHGWVFTGGKFLLSPDDVEMIIKENGYTEVHEPQAGDVVVYRQYGVVSHTAVVRYVADGQPVMLESKWGAMGVFLHPADKSPYGTAYTFHRSHRHGHLLVGVGGTSPDPSVTAPPVVAAE